MEGERETFQDSKRHFSRLQTRVCLSMLCFAHFDSVHVCVCESRIVSRCFSVVLKETEESSDIQFHSSVCGVCFNEGFAI